MKSQADDPLRLKFFPHAYGRLVALLTRRLGGHHLDRIEDAVQTAMLRSLEHWKRSGLPDNPEGWLYRVAYNDYLEGQRREGNRRSLIERTHLPDAEVPEPGLDAHADEAMVRMLLVCCHERLSTKASLVLALSVLCGLGIPEIARRLFETEANVYKLSQRARARLREHSKAILDLDDAQIAARLPSLYRVLYALYCEGYNSLAGTAPVRAELCAEAIRLATLVATTSHGKADPQLFALLALMHFGAARLPGRVGASGELLLLHEQDRTKWDPAQIAEGLSWLAQSAAGNSFTRYHAEAGVAAEHCIAPSADATNWEKIISCYEILFRFDHSPMNRLDWVVAVAEHRGPVAAAHALRTLRLPDDVQQSYLWLAVRSRLERRLNNVSAADELARRASSVAPTASARNLIQRLEIRDNPPR